MKNLIENEIENILKRARKTLVKLMRDARWNKKRAKSGPYCSRSCAGKGGHPNYKPE